MDETLKTIQGFISYPSDPKFIFGVIAIIAVGLWKLLSKNETKSIKIGNENKNINIKQ